MVLVKILEIPIDVIVIKDILVPIVKLISMNVPLYLVKMEVSVEIWLVDISVFVVKDSKDKIVN